MADEKVQLAKVKRLENDYTDNWIISRQSSTTRDGWVVDGCVGLCVSVGICCVCFNSRHPTHSDQCQLAQGQSASGHE